MKICPFPVLAERARVPATSTSVVADTPRDTRAASVEPLPDRPVAHADRSAARAIDEIRKLPSFNVSIPDRAAQLARLRDPAQQWDVIVLGGGATGSGTALEAASRGLKVALVEAGDFASGTSSRSTKLIHGGVRYLEKAIRHLDREQYDLVKEGLEERKTFLNMAPHLAREVRLVTPCYRWWEIPYYFVGLSIYDWIAGKESLHATRVLSSKKTQAEISGVKSDGLKGGIAYSDGEFNDARMNVGLAMTAAARGAAVANYVRVEGLLKEGGQVVGVQVRDQRSGESWPIRARVVVNATGPFIDSIRKMDDAAAPALVAPSAGTHIVVDNLDMKQAVLIPEAPNGSVAFFKPFEGGTLIGTTEEKTDMTFEPHTTQEQVEYLRGLANEYLSPERQIQPADVKAVWTGIRPLVRDPKTLGGSTVELSRKHIVDVSRSGLVTIGGGKWTSFGRMAQDAVDAAAVQGHLAASPSHRDETRLVGAEGYHDDLARNLASHYHMDADVAEHLARNYGDRAVRVADLARDAALGRRLHPDHPYIEAEVVYAAQSEFAVDPVDVLSRRTRLAFVDEPATQAVLPRVVDLMAQTLHWDNDTARARLRQASAYYQRNGLMSLKEATAGTPPSA